MNDDPFLIVKPEDNNKRMSTYLKKQGSGPNKCLETSSHGTTSTRSTAASTAPDDNNFPSASKTPEQTLRKAQSDDGFGGFSNSPAIGFSSDFGNGLEFGGGFGDDGFGMPKQKPKSMNDGFGNVDPFGKDDPFANAAPFGSNDPFESTGFGNSDGFMSFGMDKQVPVNFGDDGFGSFGGSATDHQQKKEEAWKKREAWKNDARSHSSSSGRKHGDPHQPRRHRSDARLPQDDIPLPPAMSAMCAKSPRTPSTSSRRHLKAEAMRDRSPQSRGAPSGRGKSPTGRDRSPSAPRRTRSGMRERRATMNHSSVPEPSHSEPHEWAEPEPEPEKPRSLRNRRASVGYTRSDGSIEPSFAPTIRPTPQRNHSIDVTRPKADMPSHSHSSGRSRRRLSNGADAKEDKPSSQLQDIDNKKFMRERSINQQKILDMYKGGGLTSSNETKKIEGVIDVMPSMVTNEDDHEVGGRGFGLIRKPGKADKFGTLGDSSHNDGAAAVAATKEPRPSRRASLTFTRKPTKTPESEKPQSYSDRRDVERSRVTLLERVAGGDSLSTLDTTSTNTSGDGKSMSYSDRIMQAQHRSKRN